MTGPEIMEAFRWCLDTGYAHEAIRDMFPTPDQWQVATGYAGSDDEPREVAPDGYAVSGPWEPYGYANGVTAWKRPLRKLPASDGGK